MTDSNLTMVENALVSMKGSVIPENELPSAIWVAQLLSYNVGSELGSINQHLEMNAKAQAIVGYFLAQANQLLKRKKTDLARYEASLYNGKRHAGDGRHSKPPSQKTLEMTVDADPTVVEHRGAVVRLEFYRDVLKELRDAVHSRSRHLEHIANNVRFEGRIDTAV